MPVLIKPQAAVEELYRIDGKAEIVNGEIVHMSPTGKRPGRLGGLIFASLLDHERQTRNGCAFPDNVGFIASLPHRKSFSPDAAFVAGTLDWSDEAAGDFAECAPTFAVEVRSRNDYGPQAEKEIRAKITDYFAAGTLVVWDVDGLRKKEIRKYRFDDPNNPTVYRAGDIADAEPAVPGWKIAVDELF